MDVTIFHNPRCSKSRATLDLLRERDIEPDVVEYLKDTPSVEQLRDVLAKLGARPRDIMRTGEEPYRALGLDDPSLDDDAVLRAMVEHPILIQRPIVVANGRAIIGRPPEKVLQIL